MPRLQWTQQAPKTVAIEVSDDLNAGWETAFEKKTGNCFTDAELKGSTNTYNDHYEGIVHWCKLNGVVHKRYVRLYLYESFKVSERVFLWMKSLLRIERQLNDKNK